jgi:hypothetical protein
MISRKKFLKLSGLASGLVLFNPAGLIPRPQKDEGIGPRNLFVDPAEIPELRKRVLLPMFRKFWDENLHADLEDDRNFLETGIEFNNHLQHLTRACDVLQREAFVFLITREKSRGDLATLAFEKILQFKKWDYILEGGKDVIGLQRAPQALQSIVLAYEWIGDLLSAGTKKEVPDQLAEKGCEPCYRSLWGMLHKEQVKGWGFDPEGKFYEQRDMRRWPWILSRTNLRAVPMSALGLGALFLEGRHPRVPEWLDVVKKTYDDFYDLYEKDGSYPEGTGYANYTSSELILMLNAMQRRNKADWSKAINWPGLMDFFLFTRMPSTRYPEGHVNFGDGGSGFFSDVGFWIARKYRDGVAQFAAEKQAWKHRIFSPIFFDPTVEPQIPSGKWHFRHFAIGWVVVTTGFEKDDFVAALRSGGPANHENADRNSLILKCFGENLLVDNWHPPYSHLHPAWALRTSPAHNTVLIDGKGHQYHNGLEGTNPSQAEAKVVREVKADEYALVTSEATQAYRLVDDNVKNVSRTVLAVPGMRLIAVVDCLHTNGRPADFKARWFVENEDAKGKIEIDGKKFTFLRPQAKLAGICDCGQDVRLVADTFPVPKENGIYPFMDVCAQKPGNRVTILTAVMALKNDDPPPALDLKKTDDGWVLEAASAGQKIRVTVSTKDTYPEFAVTR